MKYSAKHCSGSATMQHSFKGFQTMWRNSYQSHRNARPKALATESEFKEMMMDYSILS
jgi:hypothetical protein